jgi:hypothetical protein
MTRIVKLVALLLVLSLVPSLRAELSGRDRARAMLFQVREAGDAALLAEVREVVREGRLEAAVDRWERSDLRARAGYDLGRIRSVAARWVKRTYPGIKTELRRTFRKAGQPEHLWFVLFDFDVQPIGDLEVEVDTRTWTVREL